MHNYNPPNKYRKETRIGNWSEQWDLQETKRKEYLRKKDLGISTVDQKQKIMAKSLQSASLTYPKDGFRRFGDHIMIFNGKVEGFLATKHRIILQYLSNKKDSCMCSFGVLIERVDFNDGYKDNVLHYGQRFRLRINPLLLDKPVYLYSEPTSINRYSKVSRLQETIMMLKDNFNTVWYIQNPEPMVRLESRGLPIGIDDSILIKHQMTNVWLAAVDKTYQNTYGQEFQVVAHNFLVNNKTQSLTQEKKGFTTIDIPSRAQTTQNLWMFIGASSSDQQFDQYAVKHNIITKQLIEKKLRFLLTERGVYGIRFLHKMFRCLDKQKNGCLDQQDFRWGLQSGKIFVSEDEISYLISQYSRKSGVSYTNFLGDLRGSLNQERQNSIIKAFERVQKIVGKVVTLEQLGTVFDAKRHPQVLTQKKSQKDAFNQFVWSWDNIKPDYVIQLSEFAAYFRGFIGNDSKGSAL